MRKKPKKKERLKGKPFISYDDHCPNCRANITYERLALKATRRISEFLNEGANLSLDHEIYFDLKCPSCEEVISVEVIIDFSLISTTKFHEPPKKLRKQPK